MVLKFAPKVYHKLEVITFPKPTQSKLKGQYWYEVVNNNATTCNDQWEKIYKMTIYIKYCEKEASAPITS